MPSLFSTQDADLSSSEQEEEQADLLLLDHSNKKDGKNDNGNGGAVAAATTADEEDRQLKFRWAANELLVSVLLGVLTGFSVAIFKLSIQAMRVGSYSLPFLAQTPQLSALIPAVGGLLVGLLLLAGNIPPGLRGVIVEVEQESNVSLRKRLAIQLDSMKKSAGAVVTLGTGCSLGPEGPCVEIGMGVARSCMDINRQYQNEAKIKEWNRILLSCGAAAGVAAGFDAPVAGVFFGK